MEEGAAMKTERMQKAVISEENINFMLGEGFSVMNGKRKNHGADRRFNFSGIEKIFNQLSDC